MNDGHATDPKQVVLAVWNEIFNGHDLEAADRLVAPDYRQHTPGVAGGRAGFKETFARYLQMSSDLRVEPRGLVQVGEDMVVIRGRVYMDHPPPGHVSPIEVVDIFRVRDGMLAEHWEV
jgi:predicted SnoaL-like aldol condensation-catalyzing enzyme